MQADMCTGTIRIVVDNRAGTGLLAEHGFALWIEAGGHVILFDSGNQDALAANLAKLGLDLSRVSDLVLSHGHYDHSGGIEMVLDNTDDLAVYLHQAAMQPRYVVKEDGEEEARSVRMPAGAMQAIGRLNERSVTWLTHPVLIEDHIGVSGPIPRRTDFEDTGGKFFYDPWGKRPDPIEDDNAIWFETDQGLVICVGCSHAGIVNTLDRIIEISGRSDIHTVIGGLHLLHASPRRLEETASALNKHSLKRLVACHCTGEAAIAYLSLKLNCEVIEGYAGFELSF
jgi:7,8-dihydropterin-6-yl-methyl-4-(beta-D-ribofuranosyl)aminobenzene 5'-phosphate synthase